MVRFFAVPLWRLLDAPPRGPTPEDELALPTVPTLELLERALWQIEYRGAFAFERARTLLERAPAPAVFARPPDDLPALLRTADQLLMRVRQEEASQRAQVWRCDCGARYVVPTSLLRPLAIRCDQCGRTVELDPGRAQPEAAAVDPLRAALNGYRSALAGLFREAMARGWPVLVGRPQAS